MFKNKIEISRYKQNKVKIYDSKDCKKPKKKKSVPTVILQ